MTMENTAVNVSPFVTHLQIRAGSEYLFQPIDSYRTRIESTVKKLDSLIGSLTPRAVNYEGWRGDTSIVLAIRNTIGLYKIFSDEERKAWTGPTIPALWEREGDHYTLGTYNVWQDWLGDNTISGGITVYGGMVVVSLSDIGVSYLNDIADRVASLTTE